MDRIEQLRVFIRVAESGGFTAAAHQLNLPRASVSLAIGQLELRLNCRLLQRTTRRVSLTADGRTVLDQAKALVAHADALDQQFRNGPDALEGRLHVALPSRISRLWVLPALPGFVAQHPNMALTVSTGDHSADLVRDGVDLALRVGELPDSNLVARPLGLLHMVNCASPAYIARHGEPRTLADLDAHLAVHYTPGGSGARSTSWDWQDPQGLAHSRPLPAAVSVNNVESYIACGLAGLGLIQIPAFDAQALLASGALQTVLPDWPAPPLPVHLVFAHRQRARRVQVFADWLAALLAPCWA